MFENKRLENILDEFKNKTNSHSFIFYTNNFEKCREDVVTLIKGIFNTQNLDLIKMDFITIEKNNESKISKERIESLKTFFKTKSYLNKNRVYLIEEAHKLTSISANIILKFLEEPLEGVIAFFITTNLDSVLSTIKSRSQIINLYYDDTSIINSEYIDFMEKFLNDYTQKDLFKVKKIFQNYDRNEIISIFETYLEYLYRNILENDVIIIKKLNYAISLLNKNVNVDYVIDYILLGSE